MGLEQNSTDGANAMDEEARRLTENELVKQFPDLAKNPPLLKMMVEAVGSVRGYSLRPSEALDSQGRVQGSDLGKEGFLGDMEGWRQKNMGSGFEGTSQEIAQREEIRNMDPARADPSKGSLTPGRAFVRKALAGTERQMEEDDGFSGGNNDPNDEGEGGGKSVFDDKTQPGNPNPNPGKGGPIRHLPAAGRFGLRRR